MLSKRQQQAEAICRELRLAFGDDAVVINPLPLDPDQKLRVQVLDAKRDAFVEAVCSWGWIPSHFCTQYRVHAANYGLIPASVWEIAIPEERQPIPDRKIYGEVAERTKTADEVEKMRKHLGLS